MTPEQFWYSTLCDKILFIFIQGTDMMVPTLIKLTMITVHIVCTLFVCSALMFSLSFSVDAAFPDAFDDLRVP